jgi:alkylation response protein AidB-like acyl-CoA dehydrogenase
MGISFLLLDMNTPGISIVPLPTLDGPAEGNQEINQVFFDNVRVPVANRIGEEGQGWTYAKYLLQFERGNAYAPGLSNMLAKVLKIAGTERADDGRRMLDDPDFRRKLAETQIKVEALNATELRMFAARTAGEAMGAASSMLKLEGSQAQQAITELALEAAGISWELLLVDDGSGDDSWAEISRLAADDLHLEGRRRPQPLDLSGCLRHRRAARHPVEGELHRGGSGVQCQQHGRHRNVLAQRVLSFAAGLS